MVFAAEITEHSGQWMGQELELQTPNPQLDGGGEATFHDIEWDMQLQGEHGWP